MAKKNSNEGTEDVIPKAKVKKLSAADTHLLPETAEYIRTVNWKGSHRQVFGSFGTIDLTTLSLGKARVLIKKGFSKLTEINTE